MREGFEQTLGKYNELARRFDSGAEQDDRQLDACQRLLDFYTSRAAGSRQTSQDVQHRVFDLQQEKESLMRQLEADIAQLGAPEAEKERPADSRPVRYDGEMFLVGSEGGETAVSLGEIMTDGDWGINYHLDGSVPRNVRKRFLIEQARRQLQELLDQQIILDEGGSLLTDRRKRGTYQRMAADREKGQEPFGLVAERMVENFLAKLSFDYPGVAFRIERADAYQDVEQKIDFIIHRKLRRRGVKVEAVPCTRDQGVQFTVNTSAENLQRKAGQLERAKSHLPAEAKVEDIVLVSLPIRKFADVYRSWRKAGQSSGGPDKLWSSQIKEEIFRNVMKEFLTADEIEEEWNEISGQRGERVAA